MAPSFVKSTGDGMMLVYELGGAEDPHLQILSDALIEKSRELVRDFRRLPIANPDIYQVMPDRVGIGIARGEACRLDTGKRPLDYAGEVLNVASRLTDLAKPQGVVLDHTFADGPITPELLKDFYHTEVYMRGINPWDPRWVYHAEGVEIPISMMSKLRDEKVEIESDPMQMPFAQLTSAAHNKIRATLKSKPAVPESLEVRVVFPLSQQAAGSRRKRYLQDELVIPARFEEDPVTGAIHGVIPALELLEQLQHRSTDIRMEIDKDGTLEIRFRYSERLTDKERQQ